MRKAYWCYVEGIITSPEENETNSNSNKKFWQHIKFRRQDAQGVAPLKKDGKLVDDPVSKATILNEQFQSFFSPINPLPLKSLCKRACNFETPGTETFSYEKMTSIHITEEGVRKLLIKLNPHKAAGPDKIKPSVLRELADVIAPVVTLIYKASLKQGKVPDIWKEANVTPVFKKGEK